MVYFDHNRRKNADFRRSLRRSERRQVRAEKEEAVAGVKERRKAIHVAVDAALEEGFPTGINEKEQYFMDHVQQGEILAAEREFTFSFLMVQKKKRKKKKEKKKGGSYLYIMVAAKIHL